MFQGQIDNFTMIHSNYLALKTEMLFILYARPVNTTLVEKII